MFAILREVIQKYPVSSILKMIKREDIGCYQNKLEDKVTTFFQSNTCKLKKILHICYLEELQRMYAFMNSQIIF
jgi:hypothetical protein